MDDLISRQAAIDALGERPMTWVGGDYELGVQNQYDADVLAIETVPSAQTEQQWIPCSERLPENHATVLVTDTFQGIRSDLAFYCDGKFYVDAHETDATETITAWMPLPEPYKEEQCEEDGEGGR